MILDPTQGVRINLSIRAMSANTRAFSGNERDRHTGQPLGR